MNASNVVVLMPDPDLKALVKIVCDKHEVVRKSTSTGLTAAMDAGDALIKIQLKLIGGNANGVGVSQLVGADFNSLATWIKAQCLIGASTVRLYMQVARAREDIEHRIDADGATLTLRAAARMIAKPRAKLSARAKQAVTTPSPTGKLRAYEDPKLLKFVKDHPTTSFKKGAEKFGVAKATYARAHCLQRALGEIPLTEPEAAEAVIVAPAEAATVKEPAKLANPTKSNPVPQLDALRAAYVAEVLRAIPAGPDRRRELGRLQVEFKLKLKDFNLVRMELKK